MPESIGRYQITGELGRGAMGVVYAALDPTIGRAVALKTMRLDTHGISPDELGRRFRNEARAAGALNQRNIVTIYDAGEHDGTFYIAMEYVEGITLQRLLSQEYSLPATRIVDIATQICTGLEYAHARGVVHRDMKPANIMIATDGTVKIMDFGIAKAEASLTLTGQIVGTPDYMSPEQVKGARVDGRSDLFSVGVMLYEMATGERPFQGQSVTTVIYKIVNETPIPPHALQSSVPAGLSAVISRALAKSPDARFQRAQELAEALRGYRTGQAPTMELPATVLELPPGTRPGTGPQTSNVSGSSLPSGVTERPRRRLPGWAVATMATLVIAALIAALAVFLVKKTSHTGESSGQTQTDAQRSASGKAAGNAPAPPSAPSADTGTNRGGLPEAPKKPFPEVPAISPNVGVPGDIGTEAANRVLTSLAGTLVVTSSPKGANIEIDGKDTGKRTPAVISSVPLGVHTVRITLKGYEPHEVAAMAIEPGQRVPLSVQLHPAGSTGAGEGTGEGAAQGVLLVNSEPAGAHVIVGKVYGLTTPARVSLAPGRYHLVLMLDGYLPANRDVDIKTGKDTAINTTLQKLPAR